MKERVACTNCRFCIGDGVCNSKDTRYPVWDPVYGWRFQRRDCDILNPHGECEFFTPTILFGIKKWWRRRTS